MIIKKADEKKAQIVELEALAVARNASPDVRKRIEQEIRNMRAGIKGEEEAAYEIDFHFGAAKNYAVIHDLRLEVQGRVAQIDHLVIGRFLDFWVCETKNFCEGIAINEQGECSRFFKNKPYGMASPFEQNKKHIMVLGSLFKTGMVQLPTRLGFAIKPNMTSVVLVSKNARISRPKTKVAGVESIIKSDQFRSMIERTNDSDNNPLIMAKLIGTDTLENLARAIASQHKPIEFNWAGKFGFSESSPISAFANEARAHATPPPLPISDVDSIGSDELRSATEDQKTLKKKLICAKCSEPVPFQVARFCWLNKGRFADGIYCRECQKAV
ncbi:NERD domain-containing protein [Akkermansiaceae bacterium]|nr:NERD domain-containing protein [Akkermansiaceae bacterium]